MEFILIWSEPCVSCLCMSVFTMSSYVCAGVSFFLSVGLWTMSPVCARVFHVSLIECVSGLFIYICMVSPCFWAWVLWFLCVYLCVMSPCGCTCVSCFCVCTCLSCLSVSTFETGKTHNQFVRAGAGVKKSVSIVSEMLKTAKTMDEKCKGLRQGRRGVVWFLESLIYAHAPKSPPLWIRGLRWCFWTLT